MKLISHLIFSFISNLIAILAAVYFIQGFTVQPEVEGFITVAGFLAIINIFLRPILKFILTPIIIITFGLFTLVINAALLYALDFFSSSLTIIGIVPLIYSTLLITAINLVINFSARRLYKKRL